MLCYIWRRDLVVFSFGVSSIKVQEFKTLSCMYDIFLCVIFETPFYASSPTRWNPTWCAAGAYLTKRFVSNSASTKGARRSDATTFDQSKQIFLNTLPRTTFNTKVCSYLSFSFLYYDSSRECWRKSISAYDIAQTEGNAWLMVDEGPMLWKLDVH